MEDFKDNVIYELLFKNGEMESITKYKFNNLENAKRKCKELNQGLRYKGYENCKYIITKVIREYLKGE